MSVIDHGRGVPRDLGDRAFEPFVTGPGGTRRHRVGPLPDDRQPSTAARSGSRRRVTEKGRRPLSSSPQPEAVVLLIEDEPGYVTLLSTGLESRGYEVIVARTGSDALHAADHSSPDVTILDLGLPDVDGIEVCRHLRRFSRTPILVVTADGADDRKVRALTEGADDYITKPFSMPELLAASVSHSATDGCWRASWTTACCASVAERRHGGARGVRRRRSGAARCQGVRRPAAPAAERGERADPRAAARLRVGREGTPAALRTHITKLRQKIGHGEGLPVIEGHPGVGYRLELPEEPGRSPPEAWPVVIEVGRAPSHR